MHSFLLLVLKLLLHLVHLRPLWALDFFGLVVSMDHHVLLARHLLRRHQFLFWSGAPCFDLLDNGGLRPRILTFP